MHSREKAIPGAAERRASGLASLSVSARGMHCHGCEHIIKVSVGNLSGVHKVEADYPTETVSVAFDPTGTNSDEIRAAIERAGYRVVSREKLESRRSATWKLVRLIAGVAGILLIIFFDTEWISQGGAPDIGQRASLQLIFLFGLLTGFHCIGMCGGFVLSYTAENASEGRSFFLSHFLYGAGKTLSYTTIGATFGLVGAVVAFTPQLRGVAGMMAGAFLIVFGLNMLGMFAPLRRFRLGLPAPLRTFLERQERNQRRPFVIGLLNGLMIACGPLQAMYVMAAGTGSAFEGAKRLFAFGVGTLPVLMSFGFLTTVISGSLTHHLLKASGAIVVVLGAVMINRGLILTGSGYDLGSIVGTLSTASRPPPIEAPTDFQTPATQTPSAYTPLTQSRPAPPPKPVTRPVFQTITMDVISSGFSPNHFTVVKDVPVKWIIYGKQITTCNSRIIVPSLALEINVKKGRQMIEFTPRTTGVIPWSCWMGMLHGEFEVIEAPIAAAKEPVMASQSSPSPGESSASPQAAAPLRQRTAREFYIVVSGDSLRSIAAKFYRDARKWREIAAANPGLDARRLRRGQIIRLPRTDARGRNARETRPRH
jgi:sulfite exporter TauE/SafE/copper chaperone CopZ